jgi:hypothetical protein
MLVILIFISYTSVWKTKQPRQQHFMFCFFCDNVKKMRVCAFFFLLYWHGTCMHPQTSCNYYCEHWRLTTPLLPSKFFLCSVQIQLNQYTPLIYKYMRYQPCRKKSMQKRKKNSNECTFEFKEIHEFIDFKNANGVMNNKCSPLMKIFI